MKKLVLRSGHNPVPGWTPSRVDQGVDGTLTSDGFRAPWKCKVLEAVDYTAGWKGGWTVIEILYGPFKGQGFYVAEGAVCNFPVGAVVRGGSKLCNREFNGYNGILGNIEWGFVAPNGSEALARSLPGYSGDQSVQAITCGEAANLVLGALGGAQAHNSSGLQPDWSLLPAALREALGV